MAMAATEVPSSSMELWGVALHQMCTVAQVAIMVEALEAVLGEDSGPGSGLDSGSGSGSNTA